jgi:hypothetical protein
MMISKCGLAKSRWRAWLNVEVEDGAKELRFRICPVSDREPLSRRHDIRFVSQTSLSPLN